MPHSVGLPTGSRQVRLHAISAPADSTTSSSDSEEAVGFGWQHRDEALGPRQPMGSHAPYVSDREVFEMNGTHTPTRAQYSVPLPPLPVFSTPAQSVWHTQRTPAATLLPPRSSFPTHRGASYLVTPAAGSSAWQAAWSSSSMEDDVLELSSRMVCMMHVAWCPHCLGSQ